MKVTLIVVVLIVGIQQNIFSQELTLEQVLSQAKKEGVFQVDKQVEIEALKVKIMQSKRVPLIYGEANLQRNLIVPVTPVPAVAFNPNAVAGEITPLRFATNWSAKAGLQFSFDVFNPETEGAIKEAKLAQQKALIGQTDANRSVKKVLTDLYAQVVLAQEQQLLAKKLADQYMETFSIVEARYLIGRTTEIEMNNVRKKALELDQLEQEASLVLLNKKIALLPYIDLTFSEHFSTPIASILQQENYTPSTAETEKLVIDKDLNELKISNINKLAIPKLTFNAYLGSQFYNNQFRLFDGNNWYGVSYVNLALRVPITEAYERSLNKKMLLLESHVLESKFQESSLKDSITAMQRENLLLVMKQKVSTQEQLVKLTQSNVELIRNQVNEGTQLVVELNKELESQLDQQKKLWQSQYDLLQKVIE